MIVEGDVKIKNWVELGLISADGGIDESQIQPNSIDLRLGNKFFVVDAASLLGPSSQFDTFTDYLEYEGTVGTITDGESVLVIPGKTLVFELKEFFDRPVPSTRFVANPKSTSGRLGLFARLLTDVGDVYDKIHMSYSGKLYVELTAKAFAISVMPGDRVTQIRGIVDGRILNDKKSSTYTQTMTIDLSLGGWRAKKNFKVIGLRDSDLDPYEYWEYIEPCDDFVLEPNEFYIFATTESMMIDKNWCAELQPIDVTKGEFRTHYAGFIDSGFGGSKGSRLVLEMENLAMPYRIWHRQTLFKVQHFRTTEVDRLYGDGSNYQGQSLKLAKQFRSV